MEGLSERAAARCFGLARETVRKMLRYRLPPGYRRVQPIRCPKLDAFTGVIDQMINDNYSCRLPRTRSAGLWTHRESCETARFPCGGRVDHGCPGAAIARETDVGEDVGGGRGGGRDERADGATLAERRVAVDGEGASDVADAGGPVRRRVGVGGRAAVGGGYGGTTAGADAVHVAVPAASGSLSGGAATDVAAAGPRLAGAVWSGPRGVFRAGGGPGSRCSPSATSAATAAGASDAREQKKGSEICRDIPRYAGI